MTEARGELQRARAARRRRERAESRSAWREKVLERDDYFCRMRAAGASWCDGPLVAHHVLPSGRGGKDELGNGLTLCDYHHRYVHSHPSWSYAEGWLRRGGA